MPTTAIALMFCEPVGNGLGSAKHLPSYAIDLKIRMIALVGE